MNLSTYCVVQVDALCADREQKQAEYDVLDAKTAEDLWRADLDHLALTLDVSRHR